MTVDVNVRVARYILKRPVIGAAVRGAAMTIDLGVTRVELAAELGTVPETLSRAFSALQEDGLIEARGRSVTILDPAELASRARDVSSTELDAAPR